MAEAVEDSSGFLSREPELTGLLDRASIAEAVRSGSRRQLRRELRRLAATEPKAEELLRSKVLFVHEGPFPLGMITVNFVGLTSFDWRVDRENGIWKSLIYFTLAFIPLFPIAVYIMREDAEGNRYYIGRDPFSRAPLFLLLIIIALFAACGMARKEGLRRMQAQAKQSSSYSPPNNPFS